MGEHKNNNVITIDGFLASGRTSLANGLVNVFGFKHLNLETVLRRLGDKARRKTVKLTDTDRILKLAEFMGDDDLLNPQRNAELRKPEAVNAALQLFVMPELPGVLNARFNKLAAVEPGLVAVGTSMGRVVFPDAPVQVFLTAVRKEQRVASAEERIARLCRQFKLSSKASALSPEMRTLVDETDLAMMRGARPDGWMLAPNGNGWKEAPVNEPDDLELARGLQQVYINTMSMGTDKVKAMTMSLIAERMPQVKTLKEAKFEKLTQA